MLTPKYQHEDLSTCCSTPQEGVSAIVPCSGASAETAVPH